VKTPSIEVADVFRSVGVAQLEAERSHLSLEQKRVVRDILLCRTAALGGHVEECDACAHRQICYNSCRNRHCPKCQAAARAEWLKGRVEELLPVEYFHLVFTLPHQISALALHNKRVVYGLLFRSAAETLQEIAADPKHLGAEIGFIAVLHTWGQNLSHHPHLHCVVPGGGLSADNSRWIVCRKGFFLSVKVLSRVFRGKFIFYLREAFERDRLNFTQVEECLLQREHFNHWLREMSQLAWVVYAKPPFGGPEQVLKYLARYTHRVAISNQRLVGLTKGQVTFRWKDYADGHTIKEMTLDAVEFMRRFLLHVLPRGFMRIRHYGWLSNRLCRKKLTRCRELLGQRKDPAASSEAASHRSKEVATQIEVGRCSICRQGRMRTVEMLEPVDRYSELALVGAPAPDT
jgi:hypothetical protein